MVDIPEDSIPDDIGFLDAPIELMPKDNLMIGPKEDGGWEIVEVIREGKSIYKRYD